jgi:hypothetical protein
MNPTQRTLKYYRDQGYICEVVERWIINPRHPAGGFRKDYLGIIDIIAIKGEETLGIQSCGQAFAEHDRKILAEPNTEEWLAGGRGLVLIGWRKLKVKRGGKAMKWAPRIKWY